MTPNDPVQKPSVDILWLYTKPTTYQLMLFLYLAFSAPFFKEKVDTHGSLAI